jgi:hypothetical protein
MDVAPDEKAWLLRTHQIARTKGLDQRWIFHKWEETFRRDMPETVRLAIAEDYRGDTEWKERRRERREKTRTQRELEEAGVFREEAFL